MQIEDSESVDGINVAKSDSKKLNELKEESKQGK